MSPTLARVRPGHRRVLDIAFGTGPVEGWPNRRTHTYRGDDRVPGTNLTREEAQQRAKLLSVDSYEIDLDLSGAQEGGTYRSVTTVRFDVAENGAGSFIDLVAPTVPEVTLNG